jgi:hypothetical protein
MTEVELKVFRKVCDFLDTGENVTHDNRGRNSPGMIAYKLGLKEQAVKDALASLIAKGWLETCASRLVRGPHAPSADEPEPHERPRARPTAMPPELAARIGMQTAKQNPEPLIALDWALRWANQGICVFPCRRFLGVPLVSKWYAEATDDTARIVEWWSEWPDADVAGVPDKSGHFAIIASGEDGAQSLAEIEAEYGELPTAFRYLNRLGDSEHLWLKGNAVTSHHRLGRGLHVLGSGHYVYLPESWAPDPLWRAEAEPTAWPVSAP